MSLRKELTKIVPLSEEKLEKLERFNNITKALFILLLAISSNFVTTTFNCDLQKQFTTNPFVIHSFVFGIILFSINILGSQNVSSNLLQTLTHSLYIYIVYLLLTKQSPALFLISVILIISIFLISVYEKDLNPEYIDFYNLVNYYLEIGLILLLFYGFYNSINTDMYLKGDDFNFINYLFKIHKC